jgi:hypothetical protein
MSMMSTPPERGVLTSPTAYNPYVVAELRLYVGVRIAPRGASVEDGSALAFATY